jgi:DNA-binding CsgD family transcriptional regulator/tetratricopeptide (TPR) repeat protein
MGAPKDENPRVAVAADRELLGREDELTRLHELVSSLPDGPRAITLRGEPGIGKTTVWRAGLELAEGTRLLSARCVQAELPLALVGLSDLAGDAFGDVADELADHDRAVLAASLGLAASEEQARDARALPLAFLALLRLLARDEPVLIAVDDVQWLDPASARILSFAARRLGELPVGIVVTQRGEGPDPLDLANALGATYEELRLGPLSLGAIAHLVRSRYATPLPRPVLARVHQASGGNPMFALEFARSVDRDRPQLGPITIPSSLLDLVRARVERYPKDVRRLLAIVAAAERITMPGLAALEPAATKLLDAGVDLDAVTVDGDGLLRFTHPLLGAAAYGGLTPTARRSLHGELALASENVEDRARHLALAAAEPDPAAARLLDEAAASASARGAPETAAELAQEAIRLTPASDDALRFERTLALAWHLGGAGRPGDGKELLERLLASGLQGPPRARALLLATGLADDVDEATRMDDALLHAGADAALRAEIHLGLSSYAFYRGDLEASEAAARQALAAGEEAGNHSLVATALMQVADRVDLAGRAEPDLLLRAEALAREHGLHAWFPPIGEAAGRRLLRHGDLDGARDSFESELSSALAQGALPDRYRLWRDLSDVERHAGRWRVSEGYVDQAEECAGAAVRGDRWGQAELVQRRAALAVLCAPVEEARDLLARGIALADEIHWPHLAAMNRWCLGALELSLDDPTQAWRMLEDLPSTATWGRLEVVEAVADGIEALVGLGRLEAADELLRTLLEDRGRGHLWAGPGSLRCQALLRLARGDLEAARAAAEEAAAGFEQRGFPLHRARSLLVAGEALRRAGERRRAGEKLDRAREIFDELGAPRWVDRCDKELRRARPRPRHDDDLTHAERRVAALVAQGKKNREVAAQLFTTVSTVEAHLTRIYRKLGIRSRTELARLVADGGVALDDG